MASIAEWLGHFKNSSSPTAYWDYYGENDQAIVRIYRYDDDNGKRYLPFDIKKSDFGAPKIRPLYNIPGILKSDKVIFVEGEKCAEALIEKEGITATTAMSGANAHLLRRQIGLHLKVNTLLYGQIMMKQVRNTLKNLL